MTQPILFPEAYYPQTTLGRELAAFYERHELVPEPRHLHLDTYCVLLRCGLSLKDEIAVHWCLAGNGFLSFEGVCCLILGIAFPRHFGFFRAAYRKGRKAHRFHSLDFAPLLDQPLHAVRAQLALQPLHP